MPLNTNAGRRLGVLVRILRNVSDVRYNNVRAYVTGDTVTIGGVSKLITITEHPEYVPKNYCKSFLYLKVRFVVVLHFR